MVKIKISTIQIDFIFKIYTSKLKLYLFSLIKTIMIITWNYDKMTLWVPP